MKFFKIIIFTFSLFLLIDEANAQRYKREGMGGLEMVSFEAYRNGSMIEFSWEINTTRELSSIEIVKGTEKEQNNEIEWKVIKTISEGENQYIDFQPKSGQMHYKLILTGSDGTKKEYEPDYRIKGKS